MNKKYNVILFDFDGTLADTDPVIFESMNILYDKYRNGVRTPKEEMYKFSGPPIRKTLENEFPGVDIELLMKEFKEISYSLYKDYMIPYPGMKETLKTLYDKGYTLGLVSSKRREGCFKVLEMLDILQYFKVIVGFDDVKNGKPAPDSFYKAMEMVKENDPKRVIYVGDNETDIQACRNAGIECIIVRYTNRYNPNWTPDYTVGELKEVIEVVEND